MGKRKGRFLALLLAILMVFQQGTMEVLAAEGVQADAVVAEEPVTEPAVTEPEITEPEITKPAVTEPEVTEPKTTKPEVTEPETTKPEVTEPETTKPEVTEPEVTEPETTKPETTKPEVTEPEVTEPAPKAPEIVQPQAVQPKMAAAPAAPAPKAAGKNYNMVDYITGYELWVTIGGVRYNLAEKDPKKEGFLPQGVTVPRDAPVEVSIFYNPENEQFLIGEIGNETKILFQLPPEIVPAYVYNGIVDGGGMDAGTYLVGTGGNIEIKLDPEYLRQYDGKLINGRISFNANLNAGDTGNDGKKDILLGEDTITIPFTPKPIQTKGVVNISKRDGQNGQEIKKDSNGNYYIEYQITVSTPSDNTMVMENVTVNDVFTAGGSYIDTTFDTKGIYDVVVSKGTFNPDTGSWTGIGNMSQGETCTLTYKVRLNKSALEASGTDMNRQISNKAEVFSNNNKKNEATASASANSSLNIEKTTGGYNAASGTVSYTVKVTAPTNNVWTINNVTVKDIFGSNKEYIDNYTSVAVTKGNITNDSNKNTDKELDWNIGTMAPGEEQTLTYTVKVNDGIFTQGGGTNTNADLKNAADLFVDGTKTDNANATVNFKKQWITKQKGQLQPDGRIKFVIKANGTGSATGNATIPPINSNIKFWDVLSGDVWVYDGNIVIKRYTSGPPATGYDSTVELSGFSGATSWEWTETESGAYYYEIEYYVKLNKQVVGTPSVSNGAGIGIGIGNGAHGSEYEHNTGASGTGATYDGLSKIFVGRNEKIATWQSKITCNIPANSEYYDWVDSDHHTWSFTDQQITDISVKFGTDTLTEDIDYSISREGTGFKITFLNKIEASEAKPVVIDYSSILDTEDIAEGSTATYYNQAKLKINGYEDTAQAYCTYTQEQLINKTAGSYDPATGIMTWDIMVNVTGTMAGNAVVTDTLPEGLEYVKAEITDRGTEATEAVMAKPSVNGQTVTMNFSGLKASNNGNAFVKITLTTKVVDENFLTSNSTKKFENTATLEYNGVTKDSKADQTITNVTLDKAGVYNEMTAPDVVYILTINPNGRDMLKESDVIRIEDTMSEHLALKPSTLVVINSSTGAVINVKPSLKIDGNVFSFEIPDDQPITVTYRAYVIGAVGENVTVTNTVKYYGKAAGTGDKWEEIIPIKHSIASIEGKPMILINKKDDGDKTTPLADTEFTLYEIDKDGNETELRTAKADSKGFVRFTDLDKTKVYAFNETKALDGYYIDDVNSQKTYVAFTKEAITQAMTDKKLDVKVYQSGFAFERYNKKTRIMVKKTFSTTDGEIPDGSYYFGLFKNKNGTKPVRIDEEAAIEKITVEDGVADKDSVIFEGVPLGKNGVAKTYYVYETDKDGKRLSKGSDGKILVNGVKFKVSGEGAVTISEDNPDAVKEITNTEEPISISFMATKNLKRVSDTTYIPFDFGLFDETGKQLDEKQNDEYGIVSFDFVSYTRADVGTYNYTIREIKPDGVTPENPTKDGITYDFAEYKIVVVVAHTPETGLTVTVTIDGKPVTANKGNPGVYKIPNRQGKAASFVNKFAGSAKLTKTNGKDGSENALLAGAEFELYRTAENQEPKRIGKFVTDENGVIEKTNLSEGSYYFVETKAPLGYAMKFDDKGEPLQYPFEIGPAKETQVVDYTCEAVNKAIEFHVNKVELNDNDKEVEGAELTVYEIDENGNEIEVDKWVSKEGETHDFGPKLEADKDYVLRETVAPEGYAYTTDIEFRVEKDGTITTGAKKTIDETTGKVTYLVEDDITRITILKVDEEEKGVAGAKLALKDEAGNLIKNEDGTLKYSWVTTGEPHPLGGIAAGKYILSELEAPEGYELAEDVPFTLSDEADAVNEVVMTDRRTPNSWKGSIAVTKTLSKKDYTADMIARNVAFRVALFSDEARTHRISNVKRIVFRDQQSSTVVFDHLQAGKYYIGETDAYGNLMEEGYLAGAKFKPVYADGCMVELESNTDAEEFRFENVFEDNPRGVTYQGTLNITKEVVKDGKAYRTDNVYYAGIFYDEKCTQMFGKVQLDMKGQSSTGVDVTIPLGSDPDKEITLYVTEVDDKGTPLRNGAGLEFTISVKDTKVTMSGKDADAKVVITNTYKTPVKNVKTGDDTDYRKYLLVLIVSAGTALWLFLGRKREKR